MKSGIKNKPRQLKWGETIALIRPGGRLDDKVFTRTAQDIRSLGFCVALYPAAAEKTKKKGAYFSASDQDRAKELAWALSEPGIRAIFCCRGGYGAHRLIDEFEKLPSTQKLMPVPKIFVGYSDSTYLHQYLQNRWKWLSFHGPLAGFLSKADLKVFTDHLMALAAAPHSEIWPEAKILAIGQKQKSATGMLVGGNLSLLAVAGPAALPETPMILAIEDVHESFYRIDRMLRTLADAGYGKWIQGILLGTWEGCGQDRKTFPFAKVVESLRELTKGPIWMNCRFGHGLKNQRLLPLGARVRIQGKKFQTLEGVVSRS